ncbi:MAG: hypothetical protein WCT04_04805 [Planctomycetota bacterium]
MFKWLLVFPLVAFFDPFLLYWMWPRLNQPAQISLLIVYPILVTLLLKRRPIPEGDIVTKYVRVGVRVLAWYPGPISKIASFFLVINPIERSIAMWLNQRVQQYILRGINPSPAHTAKSSPADANLKPTRGRVID